MVQRWIRSRSDSGQAIILIALAMVGLLGFTALAVDGGHLMFLRRDTQNAADAALLAGTMALCTGEADVVTPAKAAAASNGFDDDGVTNNVTINSPPTSDPSAPYYNDPEYLEAIVNANMKGNFVQLVYNGPLEVTSRGVGHCTPGSGGGIVPTDFALWAMACGNKKDALKINGSGTITVQGAGVHVDSADNQAAFRNGNASLTLDADQETTVVGNYHSTGGHGTFTPAPPTTGATPICSDPLGSVSPPDDPGGACSNAADIGTHSSASIDAGGGTVKLCNIHVQMGSDLTLSNGTFYVEGDFDVTNGADITGNDVFIYMAGGSVSINGGDVHLDAPNSGDWQGMLVWMARNPTGNGENFEAGGSGDFFLEGTLYAPDSDVNLIGSPGGIVNSQVLAYTAQVGGNGDLLITYDPDVNYKLPDPSTIEVVE